MRGEIWAGDGDCWLPIAKRIQSKLFRLAVQAFIIQPPPIFPSLATSLPGPLPSCCFLITLCCRTCCSLAWNALLCLFHPPPHPSGLSSFVSSSQDLLPHTRPSMALHREHPALYTSVQIPTSHTGLTAPVHQDGVWWLSGPIRCPDTEQSSSKF